MREKRSKRSSREKKVARGDTEKSEGWLSGRVSGWVGE